MERPFSARHASLIILKVFPIRDVAPKGQVPRDQVYHAKRASDSDHCQYGYAYARLVRHSKAQKPQCPLHHITRPALLFKILDFRLTLRVSDRL